MTASEVTAGARRAAPRWGPVDVFEDLGTVVDLPGGSRARVARLLRAEDRRDTTAAHLAARAWVREVAPGADVVQRCPECEVEGHGRPEVTGRPDLGVSWSHSDGLVAVLVTAGPCGVDVERVRAEWPERAFTRDERRWAERRPHPALALTQLWTSKEALVKVGAMALGDIGWVDLVEGDHARETWGEWRLAVDLSRASVGGVCSWAVPSDIDLEGSGVWRAPRQT